MNWSVFPEVGKLLEVYFDGDSVLLRSWYRDWTNPSPDNLLYSAKFVNLTVYEIEDSPLRFLKLNGPSCWLEFVEVGVSCFLVARVELLKESLPSCSLGGKIEETFPLFVPILNVSCWGI